MITQPAHLTSEGLRLLRLWRSGSLREGQTGEHITLLQRAVRTAGFDPGPIDGIYGWRTAAALARLVWRAEGGRLHAWDTWRSLVNRGHRTLVQTASDVGLEVVRFMVNSSGDTRKGDWRPGCTIDDIRRLKAGYDRIGTEMVLCVWLNPRRPFLELACDWIDQVRESVEGIAGVEWDLEGPWRRVSPGPDWSYEEAAVYLRTRMLDLPMDVTSYVYRPDSVDPVWDVADAGVPQAYSVWDEEAGRTRLVPGELQQLATQRWWTAPEHRRDRLIMGLACYDQEFPGMQPLEPYARAFEATVRLGVDDIAYWDLEWVRLDPVARQWVTIVGDAGPVRPGGGGGVSLSAA